MAESTDQTDNHSKITLSEAEKQAAKQRFESHFGEIDLGYPIGIDNKQIDADLAKEYANLSIYSAQDFY